MEIPFYFDQEELIYKVSHSKMPITHYFKKFFYYYRDLVYYIFRNSNFYLFSSIPSIYFNDGKKIKGLKTNELNFYNLEEVFYFFYIFNLKIFFFKY